MLPEQTICVAVRSKQKLENFQRPEESYRANAPAVACLGAFFRRLSQVPCLGVLGHAISVPFARKGIMPETFVNCPCQYCNGKIEFDVNQMQSTGTSGEYNVGPTIECPHCKMDTILFVPKSKQKPTQLKSAPIPTIQKVSTPIKKSVPALSYIFIFIIGVCLIIFGLSHAIEPKNDSILPQIYGIIEVCSGWLMIAFAVLIESLARISKNQCVK